MNYREKMTRWLLDAIDTEIAKPDGEADMGLVAECTALLGKLNGEEMLSKRELQKRYRAIVHGEKTVGGKSAKKRIRLAAALAACLAVFVFVCGCGYLPSLNVIMQALFASGIGKDVEIHEVTYTFDGMSTQYENIDQLIDSEELDILIPTVLPENTYITKILNNPEKNIIYILFNNTDIAFQVFTNRSIEEHINISACNIHEVEHNIIYTKTLSETSHIAYCEIDNDVYYIEYYEPNTLLKILNNLR